MGIGKSELNLVRNKEKFVKTKNHDNKEDDGIYHVYFISSYRKKDDEPVKIGYSQDPQTRLKELQTGNPNKLKLCFSFCCPSEEDARKLEKSFHRIARTKFQKLSGEWFIIRGSWKKFIDQVMRAHQQN